METLRSRRKTQLEEKVLPTKWSLKIGPSLNPECNTLYIRKPPF
jgi:hypothetical protein